MDDAKVKFYIAAGLTEDEAKEAASWSIALERSRYQKPESMFVVGISIDDICRLHPDYVRAELLAAKGEFRWQDLRTAYQGSLHEEATRLGGSARTEISKAISTTLILLSQKWQQEFMDWISGRSPTPPSYVPTSIDEIAKLTRILDDTAPMPAKPTGAASTENTGPLLSINIAEAKIENGNSDNSVAAELKRRLEQKRLEKKNVQ